MGFRVKVVKILSSLMVIKPNRSFLVLDQSYHQFVKEE